MTELNCNEFVELVTAFLDGGLAAEAESRVVDHLAGCDGCERYLNQFQDTIRTLRDLPPERRSESLPRETRDALLAAFRNQTS